MKDTLREKIAQALKVLADEAGAPAGLDLGGFAVEAPANPKFGHLATNAAMILAKPMGLKPRDLAERLIGAIKDEEGLIGSMDVAGPGFVNFKFSRRFWARTLDRIRALGPDYGRGAPTGLKILIEHVSANPTGPLHVGHGRGAALGDALVRILSFLGHEVESEYYVNDAGRQMRILGNSVLTRLRESRGLPAPIPEDFYRGGYVAELAAAMGPGLPAGFDDLPEAEKIGLLSREAAGLILSGIKADLADFRIRHDFWFSERSLFTGGLVDKSLDFLDKRGHLYRRDGALWFSSVPVGDDKDRVLVKSDGETTYFASDIAYHKDKLDRGYDRLIDVWGADHHGYIPRVKAAVRALGRDPEDLSVVLVQMVNLMRDGQAVSMSTRSGEFVTLREVLDEVGADAARFIFLTRGQDSALDFDLDLAKSRSRDNPVFYVQYVCARVNSLLAKAGALSAPAPDPALLTAEEEAEIVKALSTFPEVLASAARRLEPHLLTSYLSALAKLFHQYYGAFRLIDEDDPKLTAARLDLALAVKRVIVIGLDLLGVEAPEKM